MGKEKNKKLNSFRNHLHEILQSLAAGIGPESVVSDKSIPVESGLKITLLAYFSSIDRFRDIIVESANIHGAKKLNDESIDELYFIIVKKLSQVIKNRHETITDMLNKYVIAEDVILIEQEIDRILRESYREYKVVLITNLIKLEDVNKLWVSGTSLIKIGTDYFNDWPHQVDNTAALAIALLGSKAFIERESLGKKYQGMVALETLIEGHHIKNENSYVIQNAIISFRQVFSYLYICKQFLSSVSKDRYDIKTTSVGRYSIEFPGEPRIEGVQVIFLEQISTTNAIDNVKRFNLPIDVSKEVFTLSSETIDILSRRCYLEEYNALSQCEKSMIKNKLSISQDWYLKSIFEDDLTDETISLFISLESLMALYADQLSSNTDEMAGNIAIMLSSNPEERYKHKQTFKNNIYRLRNKIMHHGSTCTKEDYEAILRLKNYVPWSIIGILRALENILQYGNNVDALKEYFERLKLGGAVK